VGASVHLIADPVLLQPYLQELMPLLEEGDGIFNGRNGFAIDLTFEAAKFHHR